MKYINEKELESELGKFTEGYCSKEEIKKILKILEINIKDREIDEILYLIDNTSEKVDIKKFLEYFYKSIKNEKDDILIEAFKTFDKDGTGIASINELKHMLTTVGNKLSQKEVEDLFNETGVDKSGYISYKKFINVINDSNIS